MPRAAFNPDPATFTYDVIARYPHDPGAFTQGLIYRDGELFESTGLHGRSSVRRVRLATGEVLQQVDVASKYFAEGLTELGGELFQLTWDSGTGFVYDRASFALKRKFYYHGEGWGLTHDGARLIMSDGTATLRFLDASTLKETGRVRVTADGAPVNGLNELEAVGNRIYANVWPSDRVAIIEAASGQVTGWVDLSGLAPRELRSPNAVLNGLAYDAGGDRFFVTGKLWRTLFAIRLRPPNPSSSSD